MKSTIKIISESKWIKAIDLKGRPIMIKTIKEMDMSDGKIYTRCQAVREIRKVS